jgi:hypothetical protein
VYVNVSVYDESVLDDLRDGLLQYINNNAYIKSLFNIDKEQTNQLVKELDSEIAKIDSLRKVQLRKEITPDKGQMFVAGNLPEPRLFYQETLSLYERKLGLEKNLKLYNEIIVVIQDFTPLQNEARSVLFYMFVFGVAMAVMGLFCALLWQYRKTIWKLIREQ